MLTLGKHAATIKGYNFFMIIAVGEGALVGELVEGGVATSISLPGVGTDTSKGEV